MTIKTFTPNDAATATIAATAASANVAIDSMSNCVRVVNLGPNKAFIRFGAAGATAALTDMPIAANSTEVFTKGAQPVVAAICAATETAALYFTSGEGL